MKLRELTPDEFLCLLGACPSVFETDRGTYLVVGRCLDREAHSALPEGKIGDGETAVEIPKDLLRRLGRDGET